MARNGVKKPQKFKKEEEKKEEEKKEEPRGRTLG